MPNPQLVFAYPGDLQTLTGGYGYDRRMIAELQAKGWNVALLSLGAGFPFPSQETLQAAKNALASLPLDSVLVVDGLAYGVLEDAARELANKLRFIALVHHPLCRENGLDEAVATAFRLSEADALSHARHVIVTSPATARQVQDLFDVANDQVCVALPGTDHQVPKERKPTQNVRLLAIGTVTERKGYDLLFTALGNLPRLNWHLDIVGGLDADPECVAALEVQLDELQLTDRVMFRGAIPGVELTDYYAAADVFVLASRYEGYGMAYTEALAHGLPVIGSGAGAVEETLSGGGAIYCGVEDIAALQAALGRLISEPGERSRLAQEARVAAQSLPRWSDAVKVFEAVIKKVAA